MNTFVGRLAPVSNFVESPDKSKKLLFCVDPWQFDFTSAFLHTFTFIHTEEIFTFQCHLVSSVITKVNRPTGKSPSALHGKTNGNI